MGNNEYDENFEISCSDELIRKGIRAVRLLASRCPNRIIREAAEMLFTGLRNYTDTDFLFETEMQGLASDSNIQTATHNFITTVRYVATGENLHPQQEAYQQGAFQCYSDFEKCIQKEHSGFKCGLLLAICLAERIIPFTGR